MLKLMLMPAAALFLVAANPAAEAAAPSPAVYTAAVPSTATTAVGGSAADGRLILVREGCGRGFHRNRWGNCRMNRRLRRYYRHQYWRHHHHGARCVIRDTPFGYRRVCRW
ncbi:MAG: GCG_CRPN prefix-to-repeats domain-containing protein [Pararhizobium sp.]